MGKILLVLLVLILVGAVAILAKEYNKKEKELEKKSKKDSISDDKSAIDEVNDLISRLRSKIEEAEIAARKGVEHAEVLAARYRSELGQAEKFKEQLKNKN